MFVLEQIRNTLKTSDSILIANCVENNYLPGGVSGSDFMHKVYFSLVPKTPLYDANRLQELMLSLVPNLAPIERIDFDNSEETNRFTFGKLVFQEEVGTVSKKSEVRIADPSLSGRPTTVRWRLEGDVWVSSCEYPVYRTIALNFYPDRELAANFFCSQYKWTWSSRILDAQRRENIVT